MAEGGAKFTKAVPQIEVVPSQVGIVSLRPIVRGNHRRGGSRGSGREDCPRLLWHSVAPARAQVRLGISTAFTTAGRARNASSARVTWGKSAMPTRSPT